MWLKVKCPIFGPPQELTSPVTVSALTQVDVRAMARLFGYVDVTDSGFIAAVLSIAFNPFFWNVVRTTCMLVTSSCLVFLCQGSSFGGHLWGWVGHVRLSEMGEQRAVPLPGAEGLCDGCHRGWRGRRQKELGAQLGRGNIKPVLQPPSVTFPTPGARHWS